MSEFKALSRSFSRNALKKMGLGSAPTARHRAGKGCEIPNFSAGFHSFRLIFGRAIISWNGLDAWVLFPERARAAHSR